MPEGVAQGDSLSTILFDLAIARMHRHAVVRAEEIRAARGGGDAEDDALVGWYTDYALGESPDVDKVVAASWVTGRSTGTSYSVRASRRV